MKFIIKTITIIGIASFFTACTGKPIPLHQQQRVVQKVGEHYYYAPIGAVGNKLNKKFAYLNKIVSSNLLECKENDLWITSQKGREKSVEIDNSYYSILTNSELIELRTHPTSIPKKDSKEFQNIIKKATNFARTGQSYCLSPMANKDVLEYEKYVAQQEKINNDPRVVAARIEAASRRDQAQASREQAQATRDTASAIKNATTQRRIESYTPKTNYNYNYNYSY